jgi:hypothetical protein
MRGLLFVLSLVIALPGSLIVGWVVLNEVDPAAIGTPAHAGAVSNGKPEECTTVQLTVKRRGQVETVVHLEERQVLRGTYEVDGGFGRVDILMRIYGPNGEELFVAPRATNFDILMAARVRGDYRFVFDNRYSLLTPKAIGFFYCVPA